MTAKANSIDCAINKARNEFFTLGLPLRLIKLVAYISALILFAVSLQVGGSSSEASSPESTLLFCAAFLAILVGLIASVQSHPRLLCIEAHQDGIDVVAIAWPTLTARKQLVTKRFRWDEAKIEAAETDYGESKEIHAYIQFSKWPELGQEVPWMTIQNSDTLNQALVIAAKFNECKAGGRYFHGAAARICGERDERLALRACASHSSEVTTQNYASS